MFKLLILVSLLSLSACSRPVTTVVVPVRCAETKASIGMTTKELLQICGQPVVFEKGTTVSHIHESFFFDKARDDYVSAYDGIVEYYSYTIRSP